MKPNTIFWSINTAGWFFFLLLSGVFFSYFSGNLTSHSLLIQASAFCYYLPITGLLRHVINGLGWFEKTRHTKLILLLMLITFILALIGQFLISLFMMYGLNIMNWSTYSPSILILTTAQNWIILGFWTSLYLTIKQIRTNRQQQLKQIQLESTLRATELQALKAQLNPHFIFNCLNNMRALAIDDAHTTRQMITHLSEILKYSFQFGEHTQVTVEKEVQHVKNYLALESIQFEDRLTYDFAIDSAAQNLLIPPLSIQLLVENAIKHGIMKLSVGGHIQISVIVVDSFLIITVLNPGSLSTSQNNHGVKSGVGLSNLKQRLKLLYDKQATFLLQQIDDQTVSAQIKMPIEVIHD